jgi:sugar phosphate isomerase/epimerase
MNHYWITFMFLAIHVPVFLGAESKEVESKQQSPFFALCMDTHDEMKRSIEEQNEMLHDLGFDGVAHLWLDGLSERAASAKKTGLKVFQIYFQVDLAAEPPFDSQLSEKLSAVKGQGTQLALLINGATPSDASLDDKVTAIVQKILDIAEPLGVSVVLYPHVNSWNEKVSDCLRIARRFPGKKVGVMFNLCHWAAVDKSENLESVLRSALPYLSAITINGTDTPEEIQAKTGNWLQPLDAGSFDQAKLLKILDDLGYHGPVGLQCFGIPGDARIHLERSMKKWKSLRP